jgi:hypothetical protein
MDHAGGSEPMRIRTGLTLIEVLTSILLLTMLGVTCMPLLQKAMRSLAAIQDRPPISTVEFQRVGDELILNPKKFGIPELETFTYATVQWPDTAQPGQVQVQKLISEPKPDEPPILNDFRIHGSWIELTFEDQVIFRWIPTAPEVPPETPPEIPPEPQP